MPPKKKGKGGSKKEKEEEEKRRLEEEARIETLRIQREREQHEQRIKELMDALFTKESDTFDEERLTLESFLSKKHAEFAVQLDKKRKDVEWKRYISCSALPDVNVERDMNTYINLYSEAEPEETDGEPSFEPLAVHLPVLEELCQSIESEIASHRDFKNTAEADRLTRHLIRVRQVINRKLEGVTSHIVQYMDRFHRESTENFQMCKDFGEYTVGLWANLSKNPRYKMIEFEHRDLSFTIPKPLTLTNGGIVMSYQGGTPATAFYDNQKIEEGFPHFTVVGGVVTLDLFELPELPKNVDKWTIRQMMTRFGTLKRIEYPFKKELSAEEAEQDNAEGGAVGQSKTSLKSLEQLQDGDESAAARDLSLWVMNVTYALPPQTLVCPGVARVMQWNEEKQAWDGDNVSDVEIDNGLVRFKTVHLKPTALVQNTFLEIPYYSWVIKPDFASMNCTTVMIQGQFSAVVIEVRDDQCYVVSPKIDGLEDQPMTPALLLSKLSYYGYSFVGPQDATGVVHAEQLNFKDSEIERNLAKSIAFCSQACVFSNSKGNKKLGAKKLAFRFKELKQEAEFDDGLEALPEPSEEKHIELNADETAATDAKRLSKSSKSKSKSKSSTNLASSKSKSKSGGSLGAKSASKSKSNVNVAGSTLKLSQPVLDEADLEKPAEQPAAPPPPKSRFQSIIFDGALETTAGPRQIVYTVADDASITPEVRFDIENNQKIYGDVYNLLARSLESGENRRRIEEVNALHVETLTQLLTATRILSLS